jgi:hypothetical protein
MLIMSANNKSALGTGIHNRLQELPFFENLPLVTQRNWKQIHEENAADIAHFPSLDFNFEGVSVRTLVTQVAGSRILACLLDQENPLGHKSGVAWGVAKNYGQDATPTTTVAIGTHGTQLGLGVCGLQKTSFSLAQFSNKETNYMPVLDQIRVTAGLTVEFNNVAALVSNVISNGAVFFGQQQLAVAKAGVLRY